MVDYYSLLSRFLNGAVTLYLAYTLSVIYREKKKRIFVYWGFGFLAYGVNIIIRLFIPELTELSTIGIIVFILAYAGFTSMIVGIGELVSKARLYLAISFMFPATLVVTALFNQTTATLVWIIGIVPFLLIVLSLLHIHWKTGRDLKMLTFGWVLLLVINLIYLLGGIYSGYIDILSGLSKIIIFWGMTAPSFQTIEDDLKRFFIRGIPVEYPEKPIQGHFVLVEIDNERQNDIDWIKNRIQDNTKKGIRTIFVSYYDVISSQSILSSEIDEDVFIVKINPRKTQDEHIFDKQVISITDDVSRLDLLLSDIIQFSDEGRVPCEIIMYSLSLAILTHGWRRVYSFITSNNSKLKSSLVQFVAFYSLDAHEDKTDVIKFTVMADQIIEK